MARIAGVEIPRNKKIGIGLTYIYGIGRVTALEILTHAGVDPQLNSDYAQDLGWFEEYYVHFRPQFGRNT